MGVEVQLYTFLTLVIDGSEQSTSCPDYFMPKGRQYWMTQSWHGCFGKEATHQEFLDRPAHRHTNQLILAP
jgi:hypothetical protein